jgi:nucleoside 2-deoxyribosyltransferase
MADRLQVYLAGPEVFLPDAVEIGRRKKVLCERYGFIGLYPFDNEAMPVAGERLDRVIYRENVHMIRRADFGIANLTPFRGPSADAGTVFELGMLLGLGKPVFAYTNEVADLLARLRHSRLAAYDTAAGVWRDPAGMAIEDFGNADNLMLDASLAEQGHTLIRIDAAPEQRYRDLRGFEACLQAARERLAEAPPRPVLAAAR